MMKKHKTEIAVPPLRFKGFDGEWEEKRLEDFAKVRRGLTYTPMDCAKRGVRVLRSSNIEEDKFALHDDDVFVRKEAADIPTVKTGDILITSANGSSQLVGKHALVEGVSDGAAVHGGFMLLATSPESTFLNAAMSAPWYRNFVASVMMGGNGALGNLSQELLETMKFVAPHGDKERDRIGLIFRSMDVLIASRETALEKLQTLKKAMLEKMFPRAGAKVPEVRFKGFEGEWCPYEFDRVYERVNAKCCQILSSEYVPIGKFPVIDQGKDTIVAYSNNEDKVYHASQSPVIVFGDHTREVKYVDFDFVIGADGTQLLRCLSHDVRFSYYSLKRVTLPNMGYARHFKFLLEMRFYMPSLPEQRKIGAYFRSLDALISARRDEIGKLKDLKKALLERMFV